MSKSNELTHDLYRWLVKLDVLPNNQKYRPSGNFQLEPRIAEELLSGFLLAKLLTTLAAEKGATLNLPLLSSIKNSNTPAARIYNWNILADGFAKVGVVVPKELQKEITSGNFNALVRFLIEVNLKMVPKKAQTKNQSRELQSEAIDVKKIRKYQELEQCETTLEFVIILITKNLGLTSKQAVATLSESAKYLAHMLVKGIKGSFDQVQHFLEDMAHKMPQIMYLVEKDPENNIQFLLQVLKPSLISRETEVAKQGLETLRAFNYESLKYNSKNIVYQLLCRQNEGFDFIYMGLKRHPALSGEFFAFLYPLIQNSLTDFFEVQLKKTIPNEAEYLRTLLLIIEPLLLMPEAKKVLYQDTTLLDLWIKQYQTALTAKVKGKQMAAAQEECKIVRTELMCSLWVGYYSEMEANKSEDLLVHITEELKRNTRSETYTTKMPALFRIFDLLDFLATSKNKQAALLYKKIIFMFVENHHENETRQVILENLMGVLRKFPTIPLEFLLEPFLKQLNNKEGTSYILNMYDFEFVIEVCKHPKLEEYYAISFLGYFTTLYSKSIVYSSLSFRIIEAITSRFCESDQVRDYCLYSTETSLSMYSMLVMGKNKGNKGAHQRDRAQTKEEMIINNQKKSLIIQLLKFYVQLEHRELTEDMKELVVELFVEWYERRSYYDKGLASVLMLIGDIEDIVTAYKEKLFRKEEEKFEDSKNSRLFMSPMSSKDTPDKSSHNQFEPSERDTPILKQIGLGYKKSKNDTALSKYEMMLSRKAVKPDPKVLEDIERIKEKWKLEQSRSQVEERERIAEKNKIKKLNSNELLQRNLSMGYMKLPNTLGDGKMIFDFDSVKARNLKNTMDLINLDEEEEREKRSVDNVLQRYSRYLKNIFNKYASKSGSIGQDLSKSIFAFTELMRMLKEKQLLGKIPKIAISETISAINKKKQSKNVLAGIEEDDFPTFIVYLTDLLWQQDPENKKDQPFGLKVENVILKMLEEEKNVRELFDPKILKLKEEIEFNEDIAIPEDYKKSRQVQVVLSHYLKRNTHNIDQPFISCYEIVDEILYQALAIHTISPSSDLVEKATLVRAYKVPKAKLFSQSVDKNISRVATEKDTNRPLLQAKEHSTVKKSSFIRKKQSKSERNMTIDQSKPSEKDRKRQLHAKQLKEQIERLRIEKQKQLQQKKGQQEKEEEKKRKKEELRQQYLEQNKKKLKEAKQKSQEQLRAKEAKEKEEKERRKLEVKAKEAEMLEKQKKMIEKKQEIRLERKKKVEFEQKVKQKFAKQKSDEKVFEEIKNSAAEQKVRDLAIKNSLQNGELKVFLQKYENQISELFQAYWIWNKEKMDLKGLAQLLRDFGVCNDYVTPKQVADVFKNVTKGQFLSLDGLKECIIKLSFRSSQIEEKCKEQKVEGEQEGGKNPVKVSNVKMMVELLKMNEPNYKQVVGKAKAQG